MNGEPRKPIKFKDDDHGDVKTIVSARKIKMEEAADEMAEWFKKKHQKHLPTYAN